MNKTDLSHFIKTEAAKMGFRHCGIAKCRRLDEHESKLAGWLEKGRHGKMQYMENHFEKRLNPALLVDGAKTVVSLMFNYFPGNTASFVSSESGGQRLKISKYAWGIDYHFVIKDRLFKLAEMLKEKAGNFQYRVFVDSAPVLDRAWAVEAGIGWIGKNSMLLSRKNGSFFFLAEIVCDLELAYDKPFGGSYCGDCTQCIDSCPTEAITSEKQIDARRCISYLTIELKDAIENEFDGQYKDWIFGCDICQDVCPWNKFSIKHAVEEFVPKGPWMEWTAGDWRLIEKPLFDELFRKSPLKRAGLDKLKNSINFVTLLND